MTVSVVIPNWNGKDVIAACLESLLAQSTPPTEIIVVDNRSSDGSIELIERSFTKVKLIKLPTNTGFAYAVNRGIEKSASDYVMLFNNDAVAGPDMIKHLLATARTTTAAIVGAVLYSSDGTRIDTVGEYLSKWGTPGPSLRGELVSKIPAQDLSIVAACGGAALYKKTLFDEIGLFDEKYFAYNEDVDLSLRARFVGAQVYLSVAAHAKHDTGHSERKIPGLARKQTIKNTLILDLKIFPGVSLIKYSPKIIFRQILLQGSAVVHGFWLLPVKVNWEVLTLLPKILADRRIIQKSRKLSRADFEKLLVNESGILKSHRSKLPI